MFQKPSPKTLVWRTLRCLLNLHLRWYGPEKKNYGQASSSSTPGTSEKVDNIPKPQSLEDTVEELNETVNLEKQPEVMEKSLVEDAQQRWKSFTSQSRISEKGMGLKFVAPMVVNGDFIAKLDKTLLIFKRKTGKML